MTITGRKTEVIIYDPSGALNIIQSDDMFFQSLGV